MVTLTINNSTVDLYGNEKITASYKVAPLLDISSPTSSKTTEFNLPPTANNLTIFENCNVLTNSSTLPFNLIDARLEVNGIDQQIRYCKLYSYGNVINCRLFGSETDFFQYINDKYLTDLDLSDLDFTWDTLTIAANLQTTENILFPMINYGFITVLGSNIIDSEYCYPSIYKHSLLTRIVEAAGYTLDSDLDDEFYNEIIPYSNDIAYYLTEDEVAGATFLVKQVSQFVSTSAEDKVNFTTIPTGQFGTFDYTNDEYTIPYDGYYTFTFKAYLDAPGSIDDVQVNIYKDAGGGTLIAQAIYDAVFSSTLYEYTTPVLLLDAGDKIYVKVANTDVTSPQTLSVALGEFSLTELKREAYFGCLWDVTINLPKIKQGSFILDILQQHEAIIYTDSINKIVYIAKIGNIKDAIPNDWTDKIDYSVNPEIIFDYGNYAQLNHCTYLEDETVTKPTGTDYDLSINNNSLEKERDLFKSIYAATENEVNFLSRYYIPKIGVFEPNSLKPRSLYAEMRTLNPGDGIEFYEGGLPTGSSSLDICFPYFYHSGRSYDLTWKKLFTNNLVSFTEIISQPKVIKLALRLNETDINQLDITRPVYLDLKEMGNGNFFISEIIKDLTDNSSATVELIKL